MVAAFLWDSPPFRVAGQQTTKLLGNGIIGKWPPKGQLLDTFKGRKMKLYNNFRQ